MTDLHTHILPGMDDGAQSIEQSMQMLRAEQAQGVDTVVLTPHFYRASETVDAFLERRQQAWQTLQKALPQEHPRLLLGAEVTWYQTILKEKQLHKLCLEGTDCILLELPYAPWPSMVIDHLYEFAAVTGLTPILAHVDRYLPLQEKALIEQVMSIGLPMQMNAQTLLRPLRRGKALRVLRKGKWYLGSDCHDMEKRSPCLSAAVAYLSRHLPKEDLEQLSRWP